jgi:transmembrane sensor
MSERDLEDRIRGAGAHIDPGLSDRDVDRLVEGARQRGRRRKLRRAGLTGAVGLAAVLLGIHYRSHLAGQPIPPSAPTVAEQLSGDPAGTLRLRDGSRATPIEPIGEVVLAEETNRRTAVKLVRGRARFEVAPKPERIFVVQAPPITITVIGTVFTVEQVADRVGVSVERGTVRVDWGVGNRLLEKGETGWFPPLVVNAQVEPPPASTQAAPSALPAPPARPARRVSDAVDRPAVPPAVKGESAEALLLAADAARSAGYPAQGARLLKQVLEQHRTDPRAPLAAFTLGRVLLMDLGHPKEAAAAFAEVRRLSPSGSFAEDALAREVEALKQAGELGRAHQRAEEYLRLFPGGRRAPSVRAMGGIE